VNTASVDSCRAEEATRDADGKSESKQLFNSIKEPEEHDHGDQCHLLKPDLLADINGSTSPAVNWSYLLGHDRLKKRVLRNGIENKRPQFGQLVEVRTCGRLENGVEVDRFDRMQLTVGDSDFIQAFDLCIPHMDLNEICELVTDAQYAYGDIGRNPDIPANATMTYEIELLSCEDQPDLSKLSATERIQRSNSKRERGNYLYSRNECARAIDVYLKAIKMIDTTSELHSEDPSTLQDLLEMRVKCFNNLAAAQLKMENWDDALFSTNQVLRVQPSNVKALFRKGKCLVNKGDHETAIVVLRKAAKLEPNTKIIQQELSRLEKWTSKQKKSQKAMYEKMMGGRSKTTAENQARKSWWLLYGVAATAVAASAGFALYRRFT
jgi:FK506-binding protein 8